MKNIFPFLLMIISFTKTIGQNYSNPESAVWNPSNNCWYVSNSNAGQIIKRDASGNRTIFKSGISPSPYGIDIVGNTLYACCGGNVYGYDLNTGTQTFSISTGATFLNGICHNETGHLFVSDFSGKRIHRISPEANSSNIMASNLVQSPNGLFYNESENRIIFVNWGGNAPIKAMNLADSTVSVLTTTTYSNLDGIARDNAGNYYVSSWGVSGIVKFDSNLQNPQIIFTGISQPADIDYSPFTDTLAVPATGTDEVLFFDLNSEIVIPCNEVPFEFLSNQFSFSGSQFIVESDSTITLPIINTSEYNYAYPLMQLIPVNDLPEGMNFYYSPEQFEVFASAWNAGDTAYANFAFNVNAEIPPNYMLEFTIRVTNLDPAPVDTCYTEEVFSINLRPDNATSLDAKHNKITPTLFPNPSSGTLSFKHPEHIAAFELYSLLGQSIYKTNTMNGNIQLNDLNGHYLYVIKTVQGEILRGTILIKP